MATLEGRAGRWRLRRSIAAIGLLLSPALAFAHGGEAVGFLLLLALGLGLIPAAIFTALLWRARRRRRPKGHGRSAPRWGEAFAMLGVLAAATVASAVVLVACYAAYDQRGRQASSDRKAQQRLAWTAPACAGDAAALKQGFERLPLLPIAMHGRDNNGTDLEDAMRCALDRNDGEVVEVLIGAWIGARGRCGEGSFIIEGHARLAFEKRNARVVPGLVRSGMTRSCRGAPLWWDSLWRRNPSTGEREPLPEAEQRRWFDDLRAGGVDMRQAWDTSDGPRTLDDLAKEQGLPLIVQLLADLPK